MDSLQRIFLFQVPFQTQDADVSANVDFYSGYARKLAFRKLALADVNSSSLYSGHAYILCVGF